MKIKLLFCFIFIVFTASIIAQDKAPYIIFDKKGKKVSYKKILKTMMEKDIVLFGEYHDNPIAHWLELELTKSLQAKKPLILGAEMFETDNQTQVNDYLAGKINYKALDTLARLWPNFKTDYAPLLNFAKANKLKFIATNVPARYAKAVYKKGGFKALDSISDEEKAFIAPLPIPFDIELPQYKAMLEMMGTHGGEDILKAQALRDATMAHSILKSYRPGSLFIHYNGAYHSDFFEGIYWYLKKEQPNIKIGTITTVLQEDISTLDKEHKNRADFIICVDIDMTRTY